MKRVLMVSPHFPPDTSAATHRVRLLAPHLARCGWEPTILTIQPEGYEGRLDAGVESLVQPELRIVRAPAWRADRTRRFGLGDLGLRALPGLWKVASDLLAREHFDLVFITTYPIYPALLGPWLKRRFGVPFVLDYQDPWVGAWGKTVGPGVDRAPDLKSRVSRLVAQMLEPIVVRAADAITAVSEGTYEEVQRRIPSARRILTAPIPLGGEQEDYAKLVSNPRPNPFFEPTDGLFHLCYVGTLLPLGVETLRAVLAAIRRLRDTRPEHGASLRAYFVGTSNQTLPDSGYLVRPHAEELGIEDKIVEHPARIDYLDALTVQVSASALLLMGSSEHHYTASKLYPALMSRRPLLAVFHERSSVSSILQSMGQTSHLHLVTYNDHDRAASRTNEITEHLIQLMESPQTVVAPPDDSLPKEYSAQSIAERLSQLFDKVVSASFKK